jgi:hypothetical protein
VLRRPWKADGEPSPPAAPPEAPDPAVAIEAVARVGEQLASSVSGLQALIGEDQLDLRARMTEFEQRLGILEQLVGNQLAEVEPTTQAPAPAEQAQPAVDPESHKRRVAALTERASRGGKQGEVAQRKLQRLQTGSQASTDSTGRAPRERRPAGKTTTTPAERPGPQT